MFSLYLLEACRELINSKEREAWGREGREKRTNPVPAKMAANTGNETK
jgi:hypothetical protein